jgi:hypothetical protein
LNEAIEKPALGQVAVGMTANFGGSTKEKKLESVIVSRFEKLFSSLCSAMNG